MSTTLAPAFTFFTRSQPSPQEQARRTAMITFIGDLNGQVYRKELTPEQASAEWLAKRGQFL